ncbi:DUF2846 domain-containing protein [Carboxylicivirga sp. RSCT41]|uniref:DUF2846 domain-containing protein n=1 Tax=Carboxylicivirga agarovorans TaxID=3417570 RepID=UPI003D34E5AF
MVKLNFISKFIKLLLVNDKHFKWDNKVKKVFLLLMSVFVIVPAMAKGFTPPAEGNAVVYFTRVSSFGGAASFEFFHNEEFVGIFKNKNYMRYEVKAGEHLFWASSENKQFVKANLEAGKTYIVLVNIKMGAWKAQVGLEPQNVEDPLQEKELKRAIDLVNSKEPIVTPQSLIDKTTKKLQKRGFVQNMMNRYENEWQYKDNYVKVLNIDMFIPEEKLISL